MASHPTEKAVTQQYGSAMINGKMVNDSVCLQHIDLRKELQEKRRSFEVSAGEEIDLSKIDLAGEEDQEVKALLELVEQEPGCLSQFPILAIEN